MEASSFTSQSVVSNNSKVNSIFVYGPLRIDNLGKYDLGNNYEMIFSIEKEDEEEVYCVECKELNLVSCSDTISKAFTGLVESLEINLELYSENDNDPQTDSVFRLKKKLSKVKDTR